MLHIIISFLEIIKFYLIFRFGLGVERRNFPDTHKIPNISLPIALILTFGYGYFRTFYDNGETPAIIYLLWLFTTIYILFASPLFKSTAATFISFCVVSIFDTLVILCLYTIARVTYLESGYADSPVVTVLYLIGYTITILFIVLCIFIVPGKHTNRLNGIHIKNYIMMIIISAINMWIISTLWSDFFIMLWQMSDIKYLIFVIAAIFVTTCTQLIFIIRLALSNNAYREKDKLNRYYLELQKEHYNYLMDKETDTRKFRHDIKEHILIMKNMAQNGHTTELNDYIQSVWGKLDVLSTGIHTNQIIADAIFNQYNFLCQKSNIEFNVTGTLPIDCKVESFDLCTIFSNILQNAYEAALKAPVGKISVILRQDNNIICIQAENTFKSDITDSSDNNNKKSISSLPQTTKPDNSNHGFGLINIKECLQKYNGTLEIETFNHDTCIFITNILIFNTPPLKI